jgi:hypothetical protein
VEGAVTRAPSIESFLPQLRGQNVVLHEDKTAVAVTLTKLIAASP